MFKINCCFGIMAMSLSKITMGTRWRVVGRKPHRSNCNLATVRCRNLSGSPVSNLSPPLSLIRQTCQITSAVPPSCTRHIKTCSSLSKAAPLVMPSNYDYISCGDVTTRESLMSDMLVYENFITEDEEKSLLNEVEPYLKRLRYEVDHWDNAIHGYRETERRKWNEANSSILDRVRHVAFPPGVSQIAYVHVLDLTADGVIKPHVDSVRFCGDTIAGLSLLTPSVMRLAHEENKSITADLLLSHRSLYIMRASARYDYSHEILGNDASYFKGEKVDKGRRISIICRNQAIKEDTD